MLYQYLLTGTVFSICSFTDLKSRKIYKSVMIGYLLLALLGRALSPAVSPGDQVAPDAGYLRGFEDLAAALLPGIFCFLLSWISRQGLGYGDSALVAGCGISVGLWPCLGILFLAFLLAGLWSAGLLLLRKAGRKKEIPFVPFLLLGTVIYWVGGV